MSESDGQPEQTDDGLIDPIRSSSYRERVLGSLKERAQTPTELAAECDLSLPHTSRALAELGDLGLVDLLVEEDRQKGRLYGITDRGREVYLQFLEEEENNESE